MGMVEKWDPVLGLRNPWDLQDSRDLRDPWDLQDPGPGTLGPPGPPVPQDPMYPQDPQDLWTLGPPGISGP